MVLCIMWIVIQYNGKYIIILRDIVPVNGTAYISNHASIEENVNVSVNDTFRQSSSETKKVQFHGYIQVFQDGQNRCPTSVTDSLFPLRMSSPSPFPFPVTEVPLSLSTHISFPFPLPNFLQMYVLQEKNM